MRYSVKLSKICQRLLEGKSISTVRAVATHENVGGEWYEIGDRTFSHPVRKIASQPWPVAMVMRADRVSSALAFVGMTEDQACEELLRRSSRTKSPPLKGLRNDISWIRDQMEAMKEQKIDHSFGIDQLLADDLAIDDLPCVFREQVRRLLSFLGRYPPEERRHLMDLLTVEEVQTS